VSPRDWAGRLHLPTLAALVVVLVGWALLSRRYGAYVLPAPGSIVTGFALGVVEGFTKVFYPEASNTVIFVIMALVLLVRPSGLFGRAS